MRCASFDWMDAFSALTLRDDLLLLGLRVMQLRFFARDVRAENLDVADDGAALVVDAVDVVDASQKIVEARRAEQHFECRVRVARRVHVDRLPRKRDSALA